MLQSGFRSRTNRRSALLTQHYLAARPYLYHLTHQDNVNNLRKTGQLFPACTLMQLGGREELMRKRRPGSERVTVDGATIVLRDQEPLRSGNAKFPKGYAFEDLIENLNRRIFFWPGTSKTAIAYGVRHFEHYKQEKPILLRIKFQSLLDSNHRAIPLFCPFNSGSPRCSYGKKSPRGPNTFVPAEGFRETPSRVVEVTFDRQLTLPPDTEFGGRPTGPWRLLL
jgi:hypothetical protein